MTSTARHIAPRSHRDAAPARHDAVRDEPEMIGMGYFPDEVGLAPARADLEPGFQADDDSA